jgi:hypothetical protein
LLQKSDIIEVLKNSDLIFFKKIKNKTINLITIGFFIILNLFFGFLFKSLWCFSFAGIFAVMLILVSSHDSLRLKKIAKIFLKKGWFSVEVFHNNISVIYDGKEKIIPLNACTEYEETKKHILVYPQNDEPLIIPIASIGAEYLSEVQAMIFTAARPKHKK